MKRARYNKLVSLCLSDGGIGFTSGTRYIHFTNKSEILLNLFKREIRKFSKAKIHKQIKERGITLRVFDKKLVGELLKISPSFRTKACGSFPICHCMKDNAEKCDDCITLNGKRWPRVEIKKGFFKTKKQIKEFLRIYATCDGYASIFPRKNSWSKIERMVAIICHHPLLKMQLSDLLKKLKIEHKIKQDGLFMRNKESMVLFKEEIGFVRGVRITNNSKYWINKSKNYVLNLILKSYGRKIKFSLLRV